MRCLFSKFVLRTLMPTRHNRFWFALLIALSMLAVVLISVAPYSQTTEAKVKTPTAELRGVWLTNIDSNVLFKRDRLTTALQHLQKLNFNTVYPTVWNWGYTLYPSRVAKRVIGRSLDPTPGLQRRDILREIVEQGVTPIGSPVAVTVARFGVKVSTTEFGSIPFVQKCSSLYRI